MSKKGFFKHGDYTSKAWHRTRRKVIRRSGGTCERCGERPGQHVHHFVYSVGGAIGGEPLDWLEHVCIPCHEYYHPGRHFLTGAQWMAQRSRPKNKKTKQRRKRGKKGCRHCGGTYSRERHRQVCVNHGLA